MKIKYTREESVSVESFVDLLQRSTLAQRRPVDNMECIEGMLENSNLCVSAWDDDLLIGVSRSVTDFHYACYLSDLAVDTNYQKQGVGKQLIDETRKELEETCKLILLAAPDADSYYEHLGFTRHPRAWVKG